MFAIRADHTFDGEDFRAGGATVLVEDGRIVGVESAAYELPAECELVDHGNATVLTGLIETTSTSSATAVLWRWSASPGTPRSRSRP